MSFTSLRGFEKGISAYQRETLTHVYASHTLPLLPSALRMCDRCLANQGSEAPPAMQYRNFSDTKAWDLTIIDGESYLHMDRDCLTPWLKVEGFNMENMAWDLLHNIYLGTARDLVASGLKTLLMQGCYDYFGETDADAILAHVDARIRSKCSKHKFLAINQ